jgi:hypothetical protein
MGLALVMNENLCIPHQILQINLIQQRLLNPASALVEKTICSNRTTING